MSASVSVVRLPRPRDAALSALSWAGAAWVAMVLLARGAPASAGLLAVAYVLGWIFLTAEFGYTGAFRALVTRGDGANLAAGLLVPAVAALVIVPVTALVPGYGGYVSPVGLPVLIGAAMFGVGMQLANGCGSGALYTAGGGSRRLWVALPFFCAGGLLGSLMLPTALRLPGLPAVGLGQVFGPWAGLALTLALTAALAVLVLRPWRGARLAALPAPAKLRAAALIGVLAAAAFLLSGQPWGVTMGLTLWAAKVANAFGADLAHTTTFWSWNGIHQALEGSVLANASSLMDVGMLLGAMGASAWRGGFRSQRWPDARGITAAALGGLVMGIGARLSFGCNIGALVGGLSSGSLHALLWFVACLGGTVIGVRLRPFFGLSAT